MRDEVCGLGALMALMGGGDGPPPGHVALQKSAQKAQKGLVSNSLRDLSPLFHQGVQIF
jgi:hypothetical protein